MTAAASPDPVALYRALTGLRHVRRFQRLPNIAPITVAEHSYFAALLAGCFASELRALGVDVDRAAVMEAALWHDAAEAVTGDIPHDWKRAAGHGLMDAWDNAELALLERLGALNGGLPEVLGKPCDFPIEAVLVKCADWIELVLFVAEEDRLGNTTLNIASQRIWALLRGKLLEQVAALAATYSETLLVWYEGLLQRLEQQVPPPASATPHYPLSVLEQSFWHLA